MDKTLLCPQSSLNQSRRCSSMPVDVPSAELGERITTPWTFQYVKSVHNYDKKWHELQLPFSGDIPRNMPDKDIRLEARPPCAL